MTEINMKNLAYKLSVFSIFRDIVKTRQITSFIDFLNSDINGIERLYMYGEFVSSLSEYNNCFSDFLRHAIKENENIFIIKKASNEPVHDYIFQNAMKELEILSELTYIKAQDLFVFARYNEYIPLFENNPADFKAEYLERLKLVNNVGYGIFATSKMFKVDNGQIVGINSADNISFDSFVGYEAERNQVFDNTKALLEGRPAQNVLLYGDAGTGKSSTIKACANYFYNKGLRLVELRKDQILYLNEIMNKISAYPLKFIIFIDDISFNKNDDTFGIFKSVLEGSVTGKLKNAVLYATSNRRKIIKESFSDRNSADDIHRNDTMQELLSLSDRFGLTVCFSKPNKALYLDIVHNLAQNSNITMDVNELDIKAEAFALSKGSRSPRAAMQFINSLL